MKNEKCDEISCISPQNVAFYHMVYWCLSHFIAEYPPFLCLLFGLPNFALSMMTRNANNIK